MAGSGCRAPTTIQTGPWELCRERRRSTPAIAGYWRRASRMARSICMPVRTTITTWTGSPASAPVSNPRPPPRWVTARAAPACWPMPPCVWGAESSGIPGWSASRTTTKPTRCSPANSVPPTARIEWLRQHSLPRFFIVPDAQHLAAADQRQPEQLRIAPDPGQQFRIGELIVFQAGVDVCLAVAGEQSSEAEALDESLDLARRQRLLPQIHHVDGHAALFEKPLGGARRRRVLQAEDLHAHHPLPQHNDISSLYIQHFTWSSPFPHASPARK